MLLHLLKLAIIAIAIQTARGDTYYRLNTTITPKTYGITITPYFDTGDDNAFTFDGEVNIVFTSATNIKQIKLHSEDLKFSASDITVTTGSTTINLAALTLLEFDEEYTFAIINLETEIQAGVEYNLKIVYRGPIREDLSGFYRNYYIENGIKKWLGATQFESTHARKAFPCFDEPSLKAIFTLTVDRPNHYQPSLTNTQMQTSFLLENGYVREIFYPSPRMSTYLVAFLVSELEAAASSVEGTNEFAVYTRPEAKNQSGFAFDFGKRVVHALSDFFGIDYYSVDSKLKLDHVALMDFYTGAMENWGLAKYKEALLLYVPEQSNPYYKYKVAQIITHETAHMWFGNLVTCHWWSNTWLNEGFANYFEDYITALVEPEVGSADILVTGSVYSAYDADNSPESPPITNNNVNSPEEISSHFGIISYQKAGCVIRMMHHLIGDIAFKIGIKLYLNTNKFQPGYPEKFYEALHNGVISQDSLSMYPESNIVDVMSSWITQAGHPIVHVRINREDLTMTLIQKRFYIDPSYESSEIYKIPITYTMENAPNFYETKPAFIMHDKIHVFNIPKTSDPLGWIIVNIQETGLYRVNYDKESWKFISTALKGNNREQIHHLNRAKIVNDLFAFLYSDEVSFDLLHEVLGFMADETDYSVWLATIRGFNKLRSFYYGTDTLSDIDEFALDLMENVIRKLGYEVKDSDNHVTQMNRMQILQFACKLGHQGCLENTLKLYKDFKENGIEISPSLRSTAYCTGLRYGNGDDYEFMWRRMSTTNVANEARLIGEILGCSSDNTSLRRYSSLDSVLSNVALVLHTENEFTSFESWLSSCSVCGEQAVTSAKGSLAKARAATAWADNHKEAILKSLRNSAIQKSNPVVDSVLNTLFAKVIAN